MFRMEFQSMDAVEEDEDPSRSCGNEVARGAGECEEYRQRASHSPPKIYEGRVGRFGKPQRVDEPPSHTVVTHLPPVTITRARSLHSENSIPKNWVEVDLIDFADSPKVPQRATTPTQVAASTGEQEAIRELVKPFAESVNLTNGATVVPDNQPSVRDLLSNGVEATVSPGVSPGVSPVVSPRASPSTSSLRARTDSLRSSSSSPRSEASDTESSSTAGERLYVKDEEKGSPASQNLNKAFNKFMHHKKSKLTVPETKVVKPWDEPLLLVHEQVKLQRKGQKEAKLEAKRQAEEAKREAEIQQRELLELASPVPESSLKHPKDHGMRKGIHKLFHIHGGIHSNSPSPKGVHGDVRESKLVMPRAGFFEAPGLTPSSTDVTLAQIRSGPRPAIKSDLTFATVESNQRDVQPWTMEEYMAKNARQKEWEKRETDEDFGGIEGNQLLNQYFNHDDALDNFNTDSDSD